MLHLLILNNFWIIYSKFYYQKNIILEEEIGMIFKHG